MIVHPAVQGSPEWLAAHLGIPTASQFQRIVSPKKRQASSQQDRFLYELAAERITGAQSTMDPSAYMLRGSELEKHAVTAYEFDRSVDAKPVGLCLEDGRRWGASPDRLIGEDGLLEVKCVALWKHLAALDGWIDDEHQPQCQGQMWVTGREWVDLMFYNPAFHWKVVRIARDEDYITDLSGEVVKFCDRLDAVEKRLRGMLSSGVAGQGRSEAGHDVPPSAENGPSAPAQPSVEAGGSVTGAVVGTSAPGAEPASELSAARAVVSEGDGPAPRQGASVGPRAQQPRPSSETPSRSKDEFIAIGTSLGWALGTKGAVLSGFVRAIANYAGLAGLPKEAADLTEEQWATLRGAAERYRSEKRAKETSVAAPARPRVAKVTPAAAGELFGGMS